MTEGHGDPASPSSWPNYSEAGLTSGKLPADQGRKLLWCAMGSAPSSIPVVITSAAAGPCLQVFYAGVITATTSGSLRTLDHLTGSDWAEFSVGRGSADVGADVDTAGRQPRHRVRSRCRPPSSTTGVWVRTGWVAAVADGGSLVAGEHPLPDLNESRLMWPWRVTVPSTCCSNAGAMAS